MSAIEDFAKAIENKDSARVQSLIDSGSVDVNVPLPRPSNPPALVFAVKRARATDTAIVEILLRANARIDGVDDFGQTACHVCLSEDTFALLLAHKPNLALTSGGITALETALLHYASERTWRMLLASGASLDAVSPIGLTCFASTSTSAIQLLLDRNVAVSELRDRIGATPLHLAARRRGCNLAVLSMLVNVCGVDLEARNASGRTCAFEAAYWRHADTLCWLVQAGANINHKDKDGTTILHVAADRRCDIILVAAGADVHAQDGQGRTPAHACAVAMRFMDVMVAGGANLDAEDNLGINVRQILVQHGVCQRR